MSDQVVKNKRISEPMIGTPPTTNKTFQSDFKKSPTAKNTNPAIAKITESNLLELELPSLLSKNPLLIFSYSIFVRFSKYLIFFSLGTIIERSFKSFVMNFFSYSLYNSIFFLIPSISDLRASSKNNSTYFIT